MANLNQGDPSAFCSPSLLGDRTSKDISKMLKEFPVRKDPNAYLILAWELRKAADRVEGMARRQRKAA